MKAQIEAATRPYVVVAFSREQSGFFSFKVSNVGHSAAKQLQLKSDPEIKPVRASGSVVEFGTVPDSIGFFRHSITYLAPSQSVEALVGHYSDIRASYPELLFRISLHYHGIGGPYEETVELSLKPTDDAQYLMDYDIGEELHEIRKTLEGIKSKLEA